LRPGRFDRHIFVGPPDSSARLDIFKIQLSKMSVAKNVDLHKLVADTDGFTGAEIAAVCQNAAFACLKSNLNAGKVYSRISVMRMFCDVSRLRNSIC
jgi:ATP-dependent 26S proteasome regulatory subunit